MIWYHGFLNECFKLLLDLKLLYQHLLVKFEIFFLFLTSYNSFI